MKKISCTAYVIMLQIIPLHCLATDITWEKALTQSPLFLYAGNFPNNRRDYYKNYIGLSLTKSDEHHLQHNITLPMPLPDNCVDRYQAEDVFEHINYNQLVAVINEIYRVLKPGGLFRLSLPDYRCNVLYNRATKDASGKIIFDNGGGGSYEHGNILGGGHVWFPVIESVKSLLKSTDFYRFGTITYLHYYDEKGTSITNPIDYSLGWIARTPDHDARVKKPYRCMSMVMDLYK